MTFRAILIGLLLGLGIAVFGYFNDWVLKQAYVASDLVPVSVYGLLVVGLVGVNPLLRLTRARPLAGAEWCVLVSLMLAACVIPGPGLMWNFSNSLVAPHRFQSIRPGWQRDDLLRYAPPLMLAETGEEFEKVVGGFQVGLDPGEWVHPAKVPWWAWRKTLTFWLPMLGLSFVAAICLAVVVHGQWAHRERLRYPVAALASELVGGAEDGLVPTVFRDYRFWLGFVPVVLVLLINGLYAWRPTGIRIPMEIDLREIARKWPAIKRLPWTVQSLLLPRFFFAVVGLAYFVSTDVSLAIGISSLVYAVAAYALMVAGVDMQSDYFAGGVDGYLLFGAYLASGIVVVYVGRRFYASVLLRALRIARGDPVARATVWACRILLLAVAAMLAVLIFAVGLHWLLAVLFVMLTGLMFLIVTRISAETGLFFIQPTWQAAGILLAMFGISALGPNMLIILGLLSIVATIDPRVCLMPIVANALRFSEAHGVSPRRLSWAMAAAVLLALVAGVFATLYVQYNFGGGTVYGWANSAAAMPFEMLQRNLRRLPGEPGQWADFQWTHLRANRTFLWAAGVGFALVMGCNALRLRHAWWPIHPVLFLVWGTIPACWMGPSFLVGWMLKVAITRFGGGRLYRRCRAIFIGMVAGEFVAGIFWMGVGLIYYLVTRTPGPIFRVHL